MTFDPESPTKIRRPLTVLRKIAESDPPNAASCATADALWHFDRLHQAAELKEAAAKRDVAHLTTAVWISLVAALAFAGLAAAAVTNRGHLHFEIAKQRRLLIDAEDRSRVDRNDVRTMGEVVEIQRRRIEELTRELAAAKKAKPGAFVPDGRPQPKPGERVGELKPE